MSEPSEAELAALIADIERQLEAGSLPPSLAAQARQELHWVSEVMEAVGAGDDTGVRDKLAEGATFDVWLRDLERFDRLLLSGGVAADDAARTVTLRWDLIASEDRAAAVSLANELVDAQRGRSIGGRGKKSHRQRG